MTLSPLERKAELVKRDKSIQSIADALGYTHGHVSQVLHGKRRHERTERAIAKAIGKKPEQVFGEAA